MNSPLASFWPQLLPSKLSAVPVQSRLATENFPEWGIPYSFCARTEAGSMVSKSREFLRIPSNPLKCFPKGICGKRWGFGIPQIPSNPLESLTSSHYYIFLRARDLRSLSVPWPPATPIGWLDFFRDLIVIGTDRTIDCNFGCQAVLLKS